MAMKISQHVIQGMSRDTTVSKFNPKYAFDALNIRITASCLLYTSDAADD